MKKRRFHISVVYADDPENDYELWTTLNGIKRHYPMLAFMFDEEDFDSVHWVIGTVNTKINIVY